MGGFASGLADAASNLLGGGTAAPAPKMVDANAQFTDKAGRWTIRPRTRPVRRAGPSEYFRPEAAHRVHSFRASTAGCNDRFLHAKLDDTKHVAAQNITFGAHAIMFRAALEREAILTDGFIVAAQGLVKEMTDSEGWHPEWQAR